MAQNIDRDLNQIEGKIVSDISLKRIVSDSWGGEREREREIFTSLKEGVASTHKRCCKLAKRYFIYGHIYLQGMSSNVQRISTELLLDRPSN
jgi:hypothetical protein